ncbi:MAG TPA: primosomal protein, partial [Marine Group III euryarchaeote]|nr:primosomal protein [Marine Group III euryarchaeote]
PEAFVEGIMEGKEWIWDNGILREEEVARIHRVASANKAGKAFEMFLSKL